MLEAKVMVEQRKARGMSVHEFCAVEGISPANYYYWSKRLRLNNNPEAARLVPVCIEKNYPSSRNTGR